MADAEVDMRLLKKMRAGITYKLSVERQGGMSN
jgi:hypothetical protein